MGSSISTVTNNIAYGFYSSNSMSSANNMSTQSLVVIQPIRPPVTIPENPIYPITPEHGIAREALQEKVDAAIVAKEEMDQKKLQLFLAKEQRDNQQAVINAYTIVTTGEAVYEKNDNYYASLAKANNRYDEHSLAAKKLNDLNTAMNSETIGFEGTLPATAKQSNAIDAYTNIQKPVEENFFTLTA